MLDPIKVACVGAGYFSRYHYSAWSRIEGVKVIGSCNRDIDQAKATGFAAYNDLAQMLDDTKPDLLDIITPPITHLEYIKIALSKGIRHIICQKPFCNDYAEAEQAIALAEDADAVIVVHENFRFQPWYRAMKTALDQGMIGNVHQMSFQMRTGDGQGPDAYMARQPYFQTMEKFLIHETGVHWVDTFRYLLGAPKSVYADLRKMNPVISGEDAGYVIYEFANNVRALWDANRHLDHRSDDHRLTFGECRIEGDKGVLELLGDGSVTFRAFQENEVQILLHPKNWPGFAGDSVYALQSHVVDAMRGKGEFENTAKAYLPVIEIEEAIYESNTKQRRVKL